MANVISVKQEVEEKQERLSRTAHDAGLDGVLLAAHHNIAWLTGGRSNRVDSSREAGTARLLVTTDGRRFALANAIEMPRIADEVLAGLDFQPIAYPWTDDQDPAFAVAAARRALGTDAARLGADWPLPDTVPFESTIARTRALLTEAEIDRYRAFGKDAGRVVGDVCRALTPGDDEREIAHAVKHGLGHVHARGVVVLIGSDDRLRRYRHPVPTATRWRQVVLVAVCAERDGLVVALSRLVSAGAGAPELFARTRATAKVFGRLLDETRPGASGAHLYDVAAEAYAAVGFPQEELKHHQGGAIGYRAREWVAHPRSKEIVQRRQAFAWNPSITGSKMEDTALVVDETIELITATPDWPGIPITVQGKALEAADVWRL
jgi:Xaa-Pro aminopeptidase